MADADGPSPAAECEPGGAARESVRVRPADEPLGADAVAARFRRLHGLGGGPDTAGRLAGLLGDPDPPATVECRLVAPAGVDAGLAYGWSCRQAGRLDALQRALRDLFPASFELERAGEKLAVPTPAAEADVAAVEFRGVADRRRDWMGRLSPFDELRGDDATGHLPLAAVAETMAASPVAMVYQAVFRPVPDWSDQRDVRRAELEAGQERFMSQLLDAVLVATEERDIPPENRGRLAALDERDARHSFGVNARAVAVGPGAEGAVAELAGAFGAVSGPNHAIEGVRRTGAAARDILEGIRDRRYAPPSYERLATWLPFTTNESPGIVADAAEAPSFGLLGGEALAMAATRGTAVTPGERTAVSRPPDAQLDVYRDGGLTIGRPLTGDGRPAAEPVAVPPRLQPLHAAFFGKSGAGKTIAGIRAILDNHAATDGADIVHAPKGGGMATEYLRAHYARFGGLEDVVYFDCSELLPAFGFFDIRDELAAGVPRTTAVEDTVDHYVEILLQIMGRERFEQAARSPDIIRFLVKALFDPANGDDAFAHRDLHEAARIMHDREAAPPVSDADLEAMLAGVVANRAQTFDELMAGVMNRIEKIPVDRRLARVFNHVPEPGDAHFDLAAYLDEDVVIIFDTGGLRSEAQRVLALVVLSNLWTALRRRKQREPARDHPLVNVYLEEAASIANSDLLGELLAQSRAFDCSVTLSMQFPAQLRERDRSAYDELLNNVSTVVAGNVPSDMGLAERLATDDMETAAVANRLRGLDRGQWLASLPAPFDADKPRPFQLASLAPPAGHPAGSQPLTEAQEAAFETALETVRERTRREAGLELAAPDTPGAAEPEPAPAEAGRQRLDTTLPYTTRLPDPVWYDETSHALNCTTCHNRYDASVEGLKRAVECHASLAAIDRDDVPLFGPQLKLTPEERAAADWTDRQLLFLQAVYDAQQLRYHPLEFDLVWDSMLRLVEYVDIDAAAIEDCIDAGLLRHDTDYPHRLYTVTPDGRDVIGEAYREGVDYGHGQGDLEESSTHVVAVEVARRYLVRHEVEAPDAPVVEVVTYYDLGDGRRLDIAGLDENGEIVIAVEAERINNDALRAVPDDFDKLADCEPETALWVVMSREGGHQVVERLNDPPEGPPRVEKTYSENTPPRQFNIDTAGLTDIASVRHLRQQLEPPGSPAG